MFLVSGAEGSDPRAGLSAPLSTRNFCKASEKLGEKIAKKIIPCYDGRVRRLPKSSCIFLPSFLLGLSDAGLKSFVELFKKENIKIKTGRKPLRERILEQAVIVASNTEKYPVMAERLFRLSFAAARQSGNIQLPEEKSLSDYILQKFLEEGESALGKFCIEPCFRVSADYVILFDQSFMAQTGLRAIAAPSYPTKKIWFSEPYLPETLGGGYGHFLAVIEEGAEQKSIFFDHGSQSMAVYAPGLSKEKIYQLAWELFISCMEPSPTAPLPESLDPLIFPLELDFYGNDSTSKEGDLQDISHFILRKGGLTATRYEWGHVSSCFSDDCFSLVSHQKPASVLDFSHKSEECRIDPFGKVFCNAQRLTNAQIFKRDNDLELLSLSAQAFAERTFQWLLGSKKSEIFSPSEGIFVAKRHKVHYILSLARNVEELLKQVFLCAYHSWQVVIITACISEDLELGNVHKLTKITTPGTYRGECGKSLFTRAGEADKNNIDLEENGRISIPFPEAEARRSLREWRKLADSAQPLGQLIKEYGFPAAPGGCTWENLHIRLSYFNGEYFVETWFSTKNCSEQLAKSLKIPARLVKEFRGKKEGTISAAFSELLAFSSQKAEVRRGRPSKKEQRTAKRRQRQASLKKVLANLLGLPVPRTITTRTGELIFALHLEQCDRTALTMKPDYLSSPGSTK